MVEFLPTETVWRRHANLQLSELKRMRLFATGLLALMFVLFVATSALKSTWPWLVFPRAFAEAGIVGACADWFAVVALFRHPFGIPIPHTAIIPRQKQRIGRPSAASSPTTSLRPPKSPHGSNASTPPVG